MKTKYLNVNAIGAVCVLIAGVCQRRPRLKRRPIGALC